MKCNDSEVVNYQKEPDYVGNQDLDTILQYIGEDPASASVTTNKKKKKQAASKKEDKKKDDSCARKDDKKNSDMLKNEEECKDDHKKEDSGGGGSSNSVENKKKKDKSDTRVEKKLSEETKKDIIDKDSKKSTSSESNSVLSNNLGINKNSICDTRNNFKAEVSSKTSGSTKKGSSSNSGSNNSGTGKNSIAVNNNAASTTSASVATSKKSKKSKRGMMESSSVEDLVSKCKLSEQINVDTKQTTVDDDEVNKSRKKDNQRRNTEGSAVSVNNKDGSKNSKKSVENDNKTKSGTISSKTNLNSINKNKTLSTSNSNISNVDTAVKQKSDFVRDFYKAGDPDMSSPTKSSVQEFELVSRRKNKKKPVANTAGASKSRWNEETVARDGYRENASGTNKIANRNTRFNAASNKSSIATNINTNSNNNVNSGKNVATSNKRKINFDEAPRTPHDGVFMQRLSGNVSERNIATSAPNSDSSDSDGGDSVHSMPTPSTTRRPSSVHSSVASNHRRPASSENNTPQASYANIARLASTANRTQVKKMMSSGSSAATTATSDQSLVASWASSSNSAGASVANVAHNSAVMEKSVDTVSSGGASSNHAPPPPHPQPSETTYLNEEFPPLPPLHRQSSVDRDAIVPSNEQQLCAVSSSGPNKATKPFSTDASSDVRILSRVNSSPDKDSSPIMNTYTHATNNSSINNDSNTKTPTIHKKSPRSSNGNMASVKENKPEALTSVSNKETRSNVSRTSPNTSTINGLAGSVTYRTDKSIINTLSSSNKGDILSQNNNNRILQQVSANIENNKIASDNSKTKEIVTKQISPKSKQAPNVLKRNSSVGNTNNRTKEIRKKHSPQQQQHSHHPQQQQQHDPVVFASRVSFSSKLQELSFMCDSSEDLASNSVISCNNNNITLRETELQATATTPCTSVTAAGSDSNANNLLVMETNATVAVTASPHATASPPVTILSRTNKSPEYNTNVTLISRRGGTGGSLSNSNNNRVSGEADTGNNSNNSRKNFENRGYNDNINTKKGAKVAESSLGSCGNSNDTLSSPLVTVAVGTSRDTPFMFHPLDNDAPQWNYAEVRNVLEKRKYKLRVAHALFFNFVTKKVVTIY